MLLGGLYLLGHGVPQNYSEAAKWLRPPAEHGNVNAQDILANLYYKVKDYSQALKWYRLLLSKVIGVRSTISEHSTMTAKVYLKTTSLRTCGLA